MQSATKKSKFRDFKLNHDFVYHTLIEHLIKTKDNIFFLQIGAFDGISYDELYQYVSKDSKWKGLLVEPLTSAFNDLIKNYKHREKDLIFENVAITEKDEIRQVWTIPYERKNDPNLPDWAAGCTTLLQFSNSLFGKHCSKEEYDAIKEAIVIEFVNCTYLDKLLKKHNIDFKNIDLVHIDAEGYDWKILKQLNFEIHKPAIIHFESFNLTKDEYDEAGSYLSLYGYAMYQFENNITATTYKIEQKMIKTSTLSKVSNYIKKFIGLS